MPGIPCLYYGSEWGQTGEKAPDNDYALRPCFEKPMPNELTDYIKHFIAIRQNSDALCNGSYRNIVIQNHQLVFERRSDKERILVAVNASESPYSACHQDICGEAEELLSGETVTLDGKAELPPYCVQYLRLTI